jgi:hypothetical protein
MIVSTATLTTMNTNQLANAHFFLSGTWVQIQSNRKRFQILQVAAWSDETQTTPSHYDVRASNGDDHRMIPAERITACAPYASFGLFAIVSKNRSVGGTSNYVRFMHCWSCKGGLSSNQNQTCKKCGGLTCSCGACLCNRKCFANTCIPEISNSQTNDE